jgi:hypothetical protein
LRAALAKYEVGAQLSDQVIYPNSSVDDKGEQLTGAHKYVLRFDAGKLPPVIVFWNMAMYASDMLFVENDFGRYSIGSTTDGLKKSPDGSLTIRAVIRDQTELTLSPGMAYPRLSNLQSAGPVWSRITTAFGHELPRL